MGLEPTTTNGNSARPAFTLVSLFATLAFAPLAFGDPGQGDGKTPATPASSPSPYAVVSHIDKAEQQISLTDGKLLAHRRTIDPFGIAMAGKFKGLPLVAEQPAAIPGKPTQPMQLLPATDQPTLEKAIKQLSIGAVNIASHEILIGSRSVHEGDLLVLELGRRQFVVWVQSIDQRGVQFCDINLQQHLTKPFRFGPSELPENFAGRQTNVRDFLKPDGN
jgi:hypothetical protein